MTHVTLTGVDENTPIDAIVELSNAYPLVEWGILYSPVHQGNPGRYPSVMRIRYLLETLPDTARVALHLCGHAIPNLLCGEEEVSRFARQVVSRRGRLQFNLNAQRSPDLADHLVEWLSARPDLRTITQHHPGNASLLELLREHPRHAFLVDASGGRGLTPDGWPTPKTPRWGYAGSLGPDNLAEQLPKIAAAAGRTPFWIDMESKLRTSKHGRPDHFDLNVAEKCLQIVSDFLSKQRPKTPSKDTQ